ncbi:MAG: hypothetical protein ABR550_01145 [Wenzhouxiangellaceae bacterium]
MSAELTGSAVTVAFNSTIAISASNSVTVTCKILCGTTGLARLQAGVL